MKMIQVKCSRVDASTAKEVSTPSPESALWGLDQTPYMAELVALRLALIAVDIARIEAIIIIIDNWSVCLGARLIAQGAKIGKKAFNIWQEIKQMIDTETRSSSAGSRHMGKRVTGNRPMVMRPATGGPSMMRPTRLPRALQRSISRKLVHRYTGAEPLVPFGGAPC